PVECGSEKHRGVRDCRCGGLALNFRLVAGHRGSGDRQPTHSQLTASVNHGWYTTVGVTPLGPSNVTVASCSVGEPPTCGHWEVFRPNDGFPLGAIAPVVGSYVPSTVRPPLSVGPEITHGGVPPLPGRKVDVTVTVSCGTVNDPSRDDVHGPGEVVSGTFTVSVHSVPAGIVSSTTLPETSSVQCPFTSLAPPIVVGGAISSEIEPPGSSDGTGSGTL